MESELTTPKTRRESEVWQACDDLWAHSASPRHLTGDNIRDQLLKIGYKRGSPNEIYRYRNSWKESRGISEQGEAAEGDVKSSDPISRAVSMVYDQMRTQTSEALDKLTEDYETRLKASLLQEEALKDAVASLNAKKADLAKDLASAQRRVTELDVALGNETREQVVLQERLKGAKEQLDGAKGEQERLVLELKTFHEREIDLWRTQNAELQKALTEHKKQAKADAEHQGALFSDELMKLKTELRQVQEEKMQALAKLAAIEHVMAKESARASCIEDLMQKQHMQTQSWQRKVELYLQRKPARTTSESGRSRRC
jgi:chromosome segregation ATPase